MKSKRVWRYYCEFCGKANCSKPSIEQHEKHCTMNPNRHCRMCEITHRVQVPIEEMKAVLPAGPDPSDPEGCSQPQHLDTSIKKLREITGNCPACMLAALRQNGLAGWWGDHFDVKNEFARGYVEVSEVFAALHHEERCACSGNWD